MDVQVGLGRVARIAYPADGVPDGEPVARFHHQAVLLQVGHLHFDAFAGDDNMIAGGIPGVGG